MAFRYFLPFAPAARPDRAGNPDVWRHGRVVKAID